MPLKMQLVTSQAASGNMLNTPAFSCEIDPAGSGLQFTSGPGQA